MHLLIEQKELKRIVHHIQSIILERSSNHVALKTNEDGLLTGCFDNVMAVECQSAGEVLEQGEAFVPGKFFSEIIRQLPEGKVRLWSKDSHLYVTNRSEENIDIDESGYVFKIPLVDEAFWRFIPEVESENSIFIPTSKMSYMIGQIVFCLDPNSSRSFARVGYLHKPASGRLRLVGTDSYRLSYCEVELDDLDENFLPEGICISKRTLLEIAKVCDEGLEHISLTISSDGGALVITGEGFKVYSRLSTVRFPDYSRVFPTGELNEVEFKTQRLSSTAKRVLLTSDKKANVVRFVFNEGGLTLSARNEGAQESRETVEIEDRNFEESDFSLNGRYLSDICTVVGSDKLGFVYRGYQDPVLLLPRSEPLGCKSQHLVIPIDQSHATAHS